MQATLSLLPVKPSSDVLYRMKAYHTEAGIKAGKQRPEMQIKCVPGGELISDIYKADQEI